MSRPFSARTVAATPADVSRASKRSTADWLGRSPITPGDGLIGIRLT